MAATLDKIYNNPEDVGSYASVEALYKRAKAEGLVVSKEEVSRYLKSVDAYTLHKPVRKRFTRNKTVVKGIDHQWQADLADMQELRKSNDGIGYILTIIDCFSKYAWAIPVKTKSAQSITSAFDALFDYTKRRPTRIQTDKGKEFLNTQVQSLLKSYNIHHFTSNSDQKAAVVERFNRTLKSKIWRYFTAKETRRYIDVLPKLLISYNSSYHRTIGMSPISVTKAKEPKLWWRMYGHHMENRGDRLQIQKDASVRLSKFKGTFDKGYLPNWTEEHFKVSSALDKERRVYKVKDNLGDPIEGVFYPEEIQEIDITNKVHKIEKVLKKRKARSGIELFVKWKGFPN